VRQQHGRAVDRDRLVVAEQPAARERLEAGAEQEVAVAVHHGAGHPRVAQPRERGEDRRERGIVVVVADPRLEQVAQDIEGARGERFALDEVHEQANRGSLARIEMQVGDEERAHRAAAADPVSRGGARLTAAAPSAR
jgi:hypothetical protein